MEKQAVPWLKMLNPIVARLLCSAPAEVREGFSRDLDCSQGNGKNTASGQACFQYTVLLDHGGSFMIAQPEVLSMVVGKRVCIVPGASGGSAVMITE